MHFLPDLVPALIASPWMLIVVAAVCVIDGFFPPIPSEMTVVAVLAATMASGGAPLWAVSIAAAAALGAIAGDSIAFAIGRRIDVDRLRWFRRPAVQRVTRWITDRARSSSATLILGGRYIPGGRVAVNVLAGASGLRYRRFLLLSAIAGIAWAGMCAAVAAMSAAWLGDPLWASVLGIGVMLFLGLCIDLVARRRLRERAHLQIAPAEQPDTVTASA